MGWLFFILTALAAAILGVRLMRARTKAQLAQDQAAREIAELRQSQQLFELHNRLQQETVFNSMVEGLLILNEAGRIQLANQAFLKLFGITIDIRNKTLLEVLRVPELGALTAQLSGDQQLLGHELRLAGPDERWVEINASTIAARNGQGRGTILVFHDLTRMKKLERARQEFVANVSHELRTPLSLIKGYTETLLDGVKDDPQTAGKFLQTIDRNAERLRLLIEDLLTISELESGRLKLNLQRVELRPAVEKVLTDMSSRASARQVRLLNETPDVVVGADPHRLEQVLANLVDNAIKYGRASGTVTVGARSVAGEQIEVFVQDDGPGIPSEAIERVFERFYRVDKARSREQGGTGLGLSIVKHIIQSHGGRVWARSDLGNGATFFFTLPKDSGATQQRLL